METMWDSTASRPSTSGGTARPGKAVPQIGGLKAGMKVGRIRDPLYQGPSPHYPETHKPTKKNPTTRLNVFFVE